MPTRGMCVFKASSASPETNSFQPSKYTASLGLGTTAKRSLAKNSPWTFGSHMASESISCSSSRPGKGISQCRSQRAKRTWEYEKLRKLFSCHLTASAHHWRVRSWDSPALGRTWCPELPSVKRMPELRAFLESSEVRAVGEEPVMSSWPTSGLCARPPSHGPGRAATRRQAAAGCLLSNSIGRSPQATCPATASWRSTSSSCHSEIGRAHV